MASLPIDSLVQLAPPARGVEPPLRDDARAFAPALRQAFAVDKRSAAPPPETVEPPLSKGAAAESNAPEDSDSEDDAGDAAASEIAVIPSEAQPGDDAESPEAVDVSQEAEIAAAGMAQAAAEAGDPGEATAPVADGEAAVAAEAAALALLEGRQPNEGDAPASGTLDGKEEAVEEPTPRNASASIESERLDSDADASSPQTGEATEGLAVDGDENRQVVGRTPASAVPATSIEPSNLNSDAGLSAVETPVDATDAASEGGGEPSDRGETAPPEDERAETKRLAVIPRGEAPQLVADGVPAPVVAPADTAATDASTTRTGDSAEAGQNQGRGPTVLDRLATSRSAPSPTTDNEGNTAPSIDRARFVQRVEGAMRTAQQRDGRVQVRLSPPELGSLRIEISVQHGVLTARLEAETGAARNALLDNLPALRERLAQQDIRIEKFDVDVRRDSGGGGNAGTHDRPAGQSADGRRDGRSMAASGRRPAAASPIARSSSGSVSDTGLDVRV